MKRLTWILAVAAVLVIGAVIASAAFSQNTGDKGCPCGCGGKCNGECGIAGCNCAKAPAGCGSEGCNGACGGGCGTEGCGCSK